MLRLTCLPKGQFTLFVCLVISPLLFGQSSGSVTDFQGTPRQAPTADVGVSADLNSTSEKDANAALLHDRQMLILALIAVFVLSKSIMAGLVIYLRRKNRLIREQGERLAVLNDELREANRCLHELAEDRKGLINLLAHDLRTPLSVIQLILKNTENSLSISKDTYPKRQIQEMQRAIVTIEQITQKIIDVEDGVAPTLSKTQVGLKDLVSKVIAEHQPMATQRKVSISLQAPPEALNIYVDPLILGRAVGNLVSNAIRVSPPGESVLISLEQDQEATSVQVSDKGPGIALAALPTLFDSIPTNGTEHENSGLVRGYGLYLTKLQIQKMHGCISAANRPKGGAVFTMKFPVAGVSGNGAA